MLKATTWFHLSPHPNLLPTVVRITFTATFIIVSPLHNRAALSRTSLFGQVKQVEFRKSLEIHAINIVMHLFIPPTGTDCEKLLVGFWLWQANDCNPSLRRAYFG